MNEKKEKNIWEKVTTLWEKITTPRVDVFASIFGVFVSIFGVVLLWVISYQQNRLVDVQNEILISHNIHEYQQWGYERGSPSREKIFNNFEYNKNPKSHR